MLFLVKIPCSIALHLLLYPEIDRGLALMKFTNNNPEKFIKGGAIVSYLIGLLIMLIGCFAEIVNLLMLAYQHRISICIIHFVALEVIADLSKIVFEATERTNRIL
jgi:hypothetical protein